MDKGRATEHVANMLAGYAANVGPRMFDELSYPLAKIVITRDGGAGVAVADEQPHWFAYAFTASLPALVRWKQMVELAGKDEPDPGQKALLEMQAFRALAPTLTAQMAVEACDRMFVMPDVPDDAQFPAIEPPPRLAMEEADDAPRPRVVHWLIWGAFLALVHAAIQMGGVLGGVLVGGPLGLAMAQRWGARIPNAALSITLPLVIILALGVGGAIQSARRHPAIASSSQAVADQAIAVARESEPSPAATPVAWDDLQPVAPAAPADVEPKPAADPSIEAALWNVDAGAFENAHPALGYGINAKIMQQKLDQYGSAGLSNVDMLDRAYADALRDGRWRNGP